MLEFEQFPVAMICPICGQQQDFSLRAHIIEEHGEAAFNQAVIDSKQQGLPDAALWQLYGLSISEIESIITGVTGANINTLRPRKVVKRWEPRSFTEETTTVWSFKKRGDWATHDGRYRGNWSPYVPRNLILKYSNPGDTVVDYFVGGGTTAVEAMLLGRKCIASDINPSAIDIASENVKVNPQLQLFDNNLLLPQLHIADARKLSHIDDSSVDLICAHPPYAGIVKYSEKIPHDLSHLPLSGFIEAIGQVANESIRILKPGSKCAILIGDARKRGCVIPIGFLTIKAFLDSGFILKELVIKRQHNCRATGFWYKQSLQHNFLLLAHEYLPIFEKPTQKTRQATKEICLSDKKINTKRNCIQLESQSKDRDEKYESTSVWITPNNGADDFIKRNVLGRFNIRHEHAVEVKSLDGNLHKLLSDKPAPQLIYIPNLNNSLSGESNQTVETLECISKQLAPDGFLIVGVQDMRQNGRVFPAGFEMWKMIQKVGRLTLKEIVILVPEDTSNNCVSRNKELMIAHKYLFVYKTSASGRKNAKHY